MAGESKRVMKNITRVKDRKKRVDGYYVRIQWKGERYSKLFPVAEYDTEEEALLHAREWRDYTEARIGKPRTDIMVRGNCRPSNTGVKGIRKAMVQHYKNGRKTSGGRHPWFIVTGIDETGKQRRAGVSIERHGEQKAMALARQLYKKINCY